MAEEILFKEMLDGDYLKVKNESNVAETGGGARDFRYPIKYRSLLERMFPRVEYQGGKERRLADLHYDNGEGEQVSSDVEFWPEPTESRPTEVRIGRVGHYEALANPPSNLKEQVFFALRLDAAGKLYASYVFESDIRGSSNQRLIDALDEAEGETGAGRAVIFAGTIPEGLEPQASLGESASSEVFVERAVERRVRRGRELLDTDLSGIPDGNDAESQMIEATYNYELHELATLTHKQTLQALVDHLIGLGFTPRESNIDAYLAEQEDTLLFEVKSIRVGNERAQTRKAIGQLLDYGYFEMPEEANPDADVSYAVVYSSPPPDGTVDFLDSLDIMALWVNPETGLIEGSRETADRIEEVAAKYYPKKPDDQQS